MKWTWVMRDKFDIPELSHHGIPEGVADYRYGKSCFNIRIDEKHIMRIPFSDPPKRVETEQARNLARLVCKAINEHNQTAE